MIISPNGYQPSAPSGLSGSQEIASQSPYPSQIPALPGISATQDQVQISGYGRLLSSISGFQSALEVLEAPNAILQAKVTSSNAAIASATATAGAASATFMLEVTQLAQAQSAQSTAFAAAGTSVPSGTLSLQMGSKAAVAVNINGTLNDAAKAINAAKTGVTASIAHDTAGSHLVLTGAGTGSANAFTFSGAPGLGLTQTQAASNAAYTVNGVAGSSATNSGIELEKGVTATLAKTGASTLSVAPDFANLQSATQDLATAFNTLQSSVADATAPGGQIANDTLASTLVSGLNAAAQGSFANGTSGLTRLAQIGITVHGGSLSIDSKALQATFTTDAASTASLLSKAIQRFDKVAQRDGGASGVGATVNQGLQQTQPIGQLIQPAWAGGLGALIASFGLQAGNSPSASQILAIQQYAQSLIWSNTPGTSTSTVFGWFGIFSAYA
jgi:flagellar hook-associated protein 2